MMIHMPKRNSDEAYFALVQTVILWKNDVHVVVQLLDRSGETSNHITKASNLVVRKKKFLRI